MSSRAPSYDSKKLSPAKSFNPSDMPTAARVQRAQQDGNVWERLSAQGCKRRQSDETEKIVPSAQASRSRPVAAKPAAQPARTPLRKAKTTAVMRKLRVYTDEEMQSMRQHFQMIDTDGNGVLDKDEISAFCRLYDIDANFVDLAVKLFDRNGDECLSFDEFCEFMECAQKLDRNPRVFYRKLFETMDADKNGALAPDELVEFCRIMRMPLTRKEAVDVIKTLDYRSIGAIIWDDLIHWLEI